MERGCSEKMVGMQILKARGGFRENLLERANTKICESKLTFNITYHPTFRNVTGIFEELQILVALNKEQKNVFSEVLIVGFRNGKSLKGIGNVGDSEQCRKSTCQVCVYIIKHDTCTTKAWLQVF